MKGYSLVKEAKNHFEVSHPERGTFHVSKNGLGGPTIKKIQSLPQAMADGGEVGKDGPANYFPIEGIPDPTAEEDKYKPQGEAAWNPNMQTPGSPDSKKDIFLSNPNTELNGQTLAKQSNEKPFPNATPKANPNVPSSQSQGNIQKASYDGAIQPDLNANMMNMGMDDTVKAIQSGVKAQQDASAMTQKAVADYQGKMQGLQKSYADKYQALDTENQQITKAVEESKIDPSRVWKNTSTGQKIGAAIGMILSGVGSGLTGQQNLAMVTIDSAIARDIDAQKQELGKKENLLSLNMKKYGQLDTAMAATSAQYYSMLQGNIGAAAAKSQDSQVKLHAATAIAQINQQKMAIFQQIAEKHAQLQLGHGGSRVANLEALPEKLRDRAVTLPNGTVSLARDPKSREEVQSSLTKISELEGLLKQAEDFQKNVGRTVWQSDHDQVANDIQDAITLNLNKLHDLNRLNEHEFITNKKMAPNPGAFRQDRSKAGIDFLRKMANDKKNDLYQNYLEGYNPGGTSSTDKGF